MADDEVKFKVTKLLPMVADVLTPNGVLYPKNIMLSIVEQLKKLCPCHGYMVTSKDASILDKVDKKDITHTMQEADLTPDGRIKIELDVYTKAVADGLSAETIKLVIPGKTIFTPIGENQVQMKVFEPESVLIVRVG